MSINSILYTPDTNNKWRRRGANNVTGVNRSHFTHSERQLLGQYPDNLVLIVQDAYPCNFCHAHFIEQSRNRAIIFKITPDNGQYSKDHGFVRGPIPCLIYYFHGTAVYVSMTNRNPLPTSFPVHPDFEAY
jgi:hypothetical protein